MNRLTRASLKGLLRLLKLFFRFGLLGDVGGSNRIIPIE